MLLIIFRWRDKAGESTPSVSMAIDFFGFGAKFDFWIGDNQENNERPCEVEATITRKTKRPAA